MGQQRTPHGDEVLTGDEMEGAGVLPRSPRTGRLPAPAPAAARTPGAFGGDDETGAGISSRDADREDPEPG